MNNVWTISELDKRVKAGTLRGYSLKTIQKEKKKSKYGNIKVEVDGIEFDSKKEAKRYGELKLLRKIGEIGQLEYHKIFPLIVEGKLVAKYEADFVYLTKDGKQIVEDVKSEMTRKLPTYRLKKKLMLSIYQIEIQEV